jgi:hypothetical protein
MSSQTQYWPGDLTSITLNSANPRFDFTLNYYDAVNDWPSYLSGSVNVSSLLPLTGAALHREAARHALVALDLTRSHRRAVVEAVEETNPVCWLCRADPLQCTLQGMPPGNSSRLELMPGAPYYGLTGASSGFGITCGQTELRRSYSDRVLSSERRA